MRLRWTVNYTIVDHWANFAIYLAVQSRHLNGCTRKHTEQEIIAVLRKLGYEIPATVVGSARKKFLCKAGL